MLNDADGHGGGEAGEAVKDAEALFRRLKKEAAILATTFQTIAENMRAAHHTDLFSADIARLEPVARLLGGGDRT